ncbi:hypothetical protein [Leptolyngbya sp. ST-U4]|uniref:hypothetical protein n=1 Tax=Leptolyngbya sp. ST-U4 TaxID=2933912 RepID=UPI00329A3BED
MQGIVEFLLQNGQSLFLLILCGVIGCGVYLLVRELQDQKSSPRRQHSSIRSTSIRSTPIRSSPIRSSPQNRGIKRNTRGRFHLSHPLHGKLVKLLGGDQKAAIRLIASYQAKFPDKPNQWHYEKAIYDLSRDRH